MARAFDLGLAPADLVQPGLGEDVVDVQGAATAEHVPFEGYPRAPVPRLAHAGQEVQDGVEPGTDTPPDEVPRLDTEVPAPQTELIEEPVEATVHVLELVQVLIDGRLGRGREPPPHGVLQVPVEQAVLLLAVIQPATAAVHVVRHDRERVTAEQHAVVVQAEAVRDEVEQQIAGSLRTAESFLDFGGLDMVHGHEAGLAGQYGVDVPQQPVEVELVVGVLPGGQDLLHLIAGLWPAGADFG